MSAGGRYGAAMIPLWINLMGILEDGENWCIDVASVYGSIALIFLSPFSDIARGMSFCGRL